MRYDSSPITIKVIKWSIRSWWDDLIWLAMVNLALVVCWITVIFGPPATLGLYYISHELIRGQALGFSGLIEGARKYFFKSWGWALANLLVLLLLWSNIVFYGNIDVVWVKGLPIVMFLLGLVWLVVQFYALPFLMLQEQKSLIVAWRNAYLIAALYPKYTLVIMLFVVLILVISLVLMLPLFLGALPLISILGCWAVRDRVDEYNRQYKKTI